MGQAIGQMLPVAIGVALSPFPIVAVVLMLATPSGRVNGPAFILGWWLGLAVVGTIVLSIAGDADATESSGAPATWVSVLKLLLGIALLVVGVREWRGRPHDAEEAAVPKWMGAIDKFRPLTALGLGALLSGLNPKNTLLAIGAAAGIASYGLSTGDEIVVYVVFVLVATIGVGAPVAIYFALGERSEHILDGLKAWMVANNAVIMSVLLLVIGVKLIGDAISGFST
jgi:threonine/homoserine/homoserine lactone efflux protein